MVSLLKLAEVTEEGVQFESTYSSSSSFGRKKHTSKAVQAEKEASSSSSDDEAPPAGTELLVLTPEKSMEIQNAIGGDIIMQLDDVVSSTISGPRVEEAMHRYKILHRKIFFNLLTFHSISQVSEMAGAMQRSP